MRNSPVVIDQLLDKLANDDGFRDRLAADPVGALGELGITVAADQIPANVKLPSKDAIAANRDAMKGRLLTGDDMVYFLLDA